jgi:acyl-CoA thioester hydrolase
MQTHAIEIRVRYPEVDAMGFVHHSRFLQYFEMGRVELLRANGQSYADLEREGIFFVVTKIQVNYRAPARYDEVLKLDTSIVRMTTVRIDHIYKMTREGVLIAEGASTIACMGRDGQVRQIPQQMRGEGGFQE